MITITVAVYSCVVAAVVIVVFVWWFGRSTMSYGCWVCFSSIFHLPSSIAIVFLFPPRLRISVSNNASNAVVELID